MKTIDKYLTMLVRGVIGVALIVLFVVAFSVIIGRIFFDASMGWSQDVIRLCFTYIIYYHLSGRRILRTRKRAPEC